MEQHLLEIKNGFNFRDIGGYPTIDGKMIKMHKAVRSGMLNPLSDDDLNYLNEYGIRVDVDFRSPNEQEEYPDKVPSMAKYVNDSVFPSDETNSTAKNQMRKQAFKEDPEAGYHDMLNSYKDIVLAPSAQHAYRIFFDELLANSTDDEAVLFHCTAGKDRTGMGAVYLMTILGVPDEIIREDYLSSNKHLALNQQNKQKLYHDLGPIFLKNVEALTHVYDEYLDTALNVICAEAGNVHNYVEQVLKVTPQQQRDLKQIYLTDNEQ